ncbi:MAG: ATP-grasp domain-containing protein [Acutalibacteraceae bacterium]|nr:ATP-grasp domain-containing protein [Acutalibacteraceae bacterium]
MKKVLIIGAGFLQSFVIRKARELGYEVLAVDADKNAVGFKYAHKHAVINIVDEKACLEYARKENIDGVLTAATDYGVLTASFIAEQLGLNGIDYSVAKIIKNKYQVRKKLTLSGADDTGEVFQVSSVEEAEKIKNEIDYPVMVKPCDGSGSRGASKVEKAEDLTVACELAISNSLSRLSTVEPFIVGNEYGVESFVKDGEIYVLGVMKKTMTKPPFYAELGHALPNGLDKAVEEKIRNCAEKAIKTLGIDFGSVNMDLLLTENGEVHIVDIGARMGGNLIGSHIIPIGTGIDYMGNMIKAFVNDDYDFSPVNKCKDVSTRLLALSAGVVEKLPDFASLENENVIIEHRLNVGDEIMPYRTNLDGCGYVVCTGEGCEEKAESIKEYIDKNIVRKQ